MMMDWGRKDRQNWGTCIPAEESKLTMMGICIRQFGSGTGEREGEHFTCGGRWWSATMREGYTRRLTSRPRATGPKACVSFFLNKISSSSGEDRSCWKGVKIGFGYRWLVFVDDC